MSGHTPFRDLRSGERARRSNMSWRGPCEAGVAINDDFGKPLVRLCNEPGRWFAGGFAFGMMLCKEHESLKERFDLMAMRIGEIRQKKKGQVGE